LIYLIDLHEYNYETGRSCLPAGAMSGNLP